MKTMGRHEKMKQHLFLSKRHSVYHSDHLKNCTVTESCRFSVRPTIVGWAYDIALQDIAQLMPIMSDSAQFTKTTMAHPNQNQIYFTAYRGALFGTLRI
uniref:AlNc14C249G9613 protein n=1 Tax=Albugo laibachii Nc14 TaxID=890382 RepID=F0WTD3_9STRA|nr:AlNc14C249G9613 [Albugo laibachii Nc14]|eukprot:CCA24623.1 AlNc14C249G9613 [Albugo laibachii Nc14]